MDEKKFDERTEMKIDNDPDNSVSKMTEKIKSNPWIVVSVVLGIIAVILLILTLRGGITGNVISGDEAGQNLVDFGTMQGLSVEVLSIVKDGQFYDAVISVNGQQSNVKLTKDGKNLVQLIPIITGDVVDNSNTDTQATEVPKSDKPIVELYVFTYCPYGTQSEKGIIPVVKLLGDKIDFRIRQIGAMHGEYEKIEAERQLCIEKNYPDKLLDYTLDFASSSEIGACNGDATCVGPKIDALYTKLGINKATIDNCMKSEGETLYAAEESNSKSQGVSGSPTLIINGVQASSGRDSASYLKTICSAFNTAPGECDTVLSSASPSAGFGSSTSSASSSSAQC